MSVGRTSVLIATLFLIGATAIGRRAEGVIRGKVTEQQDGKPVADALVSLRLGLDSIVGEAGTDSAGRYAFEGVAPGRGYRITVNRIGFLDASRGDVELREGDTVTVDFALLPKPVTLDTLNVAAEKHRWKKYYKPVTRSEIRETKGLITAQDIFRTIRPIALTARLEECDHVELKLYVDSVRVDLPMDELLYDSLTITPYLRRAVRQRNFAPVWVALGRLRIEEVIKIEFRDCWVDFRPIKYRNSIWITTKRAKWLGEEEGFW